MKRKQRYGSSLLVVATSKRYGMIRADFTLSLAYGLAWNENLSKSTIVDYLLLSGESYNQVNRSFSYRLGFSVTELTSGTGKVLLNADISPAAFSLPCSAQRISALLYDSKLPVSTLTTFDDELCLILACARTTLGKT
jgi:hypothetical protein